MPRQVPQKRGRASPGREQQKSEFIAFGGGYDSDTPPISLPPGFARRASNYEQAIVGGYQTHKGFERYSGKAKPSAATYSMLPCSTPGTNAANGTVTITGAISGATGVVIAATTTHLVLAQVTGTFQAESASPGGVVVTGAQSVGTAPTQLLRAQYTNLAADVRRALIAAVPGEGKILGVTGFYFGSTDVVYAFRNAVGGATAAMYKSTASGWSLVALNEEISFSNANTSVQDADVLTQGAVTATIARVVVQTGTLASGVNTGRLIISGRAGGNFAGAVATSTGGGALTLSGAQTAITLQPNGRYKFISATFGGGANTQRLYGVDGANRGFEFDGATFVPIATGMAADTPSFLYQHKNHLFYAFAGSAQHSGIGTPYVWSVISGSLELAMGDTITGFMQQAGSDTNASLTLTTRNTIAILYGTSALTWNLIQYKKEVGAIAHTLQQVGHTLMLDDRGVTKLEATLNFGNFSDASMSRHIKTWLAGKGALVTDSCVIQDKSQYRIYFSDSSAIYATIVPGRDGTTAAFIPQLFPFPVRCISSTENVAGDVVIFFGSDDGYIYQMEHGTSFDGADIDSHIELAYNHSKSPRINKEYTKAALEVTVSGYSEIVIGYALGYGASDIIQPGDDTETLGVGANYYDAGVTYDSGLVYDGEPLRMSAIDLAGEAVNISMKLKSRSDYFSSVTFSGVVINYVLRDAVT